YEAPAVIPWRTPDCLLADPIEHYDPGKKGKAAIELSILCAWVDALQTKRSPEGQPRNWSMPAHLEDQANLIDRLLEAWQEQLEKYRQPNLRINEYSQIPTSGRPLSPPLASILDLGQPYGLTAPVSDLLLQSHKLGV